MSKELSGGTIINDIYGNEYRILGKLSEGAQGRIYELENNLIAKINYDKKNNREKKIEQLNWIMSKDIPREARIAKPLVVLAKPYTGYIMKRVPEDYEPLSKYINVTTKYPYKEWYNDITGGLKKRLQIGGMLAKCFRHLHFEGLTYCDLSPANILVSPTKNSIAIIDADNLMATDIFTSDVLGTEGYIAPELINQSRQPNSLSDVYSFAVLLFELIGMGHPLVGDSIINDAPEVEIDAKRGNAVYVNHPKDDTNRSKRASMFLSLLTSEMKYLFERTFTVGIQTPSARPSLKEFIEAIETCLDQLIYCKNPNCGGAFLGEIGGEVKCPFCDTRFEKVDHLKFYRSTGIKGYEIIDLQADKDFMNLPSVVETPYKIVINKAVTYLRKRHFDIDIHANRDDKVLKVIKNGKNQFTVMALEEALPIYLKDKGKRPSLMKVGQEYDFVFDKTAVLFRPNSNLIDGTALGTDLEDTGYDNNEENKLSVTEYVAIYY